VRACKRRRQSRAVGSGLLRCHGCSGCLVRFCRLHGARQRLEAVIFGGRGRRGHGEGCWSNDTGARGMLGAVRAVECVCLDSAAKLAVEALSSHTRRAGVGRRGRKCLEVHSRALAVRAMLCCNARRSAVQCCSLRRMQSV
jgi:hypothetical protein